jgi:hypothetical protein
LRRFSEPVEAVEAQAIVEARLDEDFFATRLERATDGEVTYLRALAELGGEPQRTSAVADQMGRPVQRVAETRARLIDKGSLYAPKRGLTCFTVPQFDRFLRRAFPQDPRRGRAPS